MLGRPTEAPKAIEVGLRLVHLDAGDVARVWDYLRLLLRHWDDVEAVCERTGPLWLQLSTTRATPIELPYEPGKPPRLAADPRSDRIRQAKPQRRRASGAQRRRRRAVADPQQHALHVDPPQDESDEHPDG